MCVLDRLCSLQRRRADEVFISAFCGDIPRALAAHRHYCNSGEVHETVTRYCEHELVRMGQDLNQQVLL